MITDQIKQQVMDKLAALLVIANTRYNRNLNVPPVVWDCNDTRGGYYRTRDGSLHFNPTLCIQNLQHYLDTTVPHEMAHFVQHQVYPETLYPADRIFKKARRSLHGRAWQSIMRAFGISNPERCHSYDVSEVKRKRVFKKVPVYCPCSVHQVTPKLANNLQWGRIYTCTLCKGKISLTNPLTVVPQPV